MVSDSQTTELTDNRLPYRGIAILPLFALAVLFLAVFGNGIDINRNVDRSLGVSLSFQVVLRIVVGMSALYAGIWGWWRLPAVRQLMLTYRGWLMFLFVAFAYAAVPKSGEPAVALFVATMMLGYLLLTITCLVLFGFKTVAIVVMAAVWFYVLLGWVAYYIFPEFGVYREFLSLSQFVDRMGGLGHPNTTGRSVCLGTVMLFVACKERWVSRYWAAVAIPILIATLIFTKSRSPVIATVVAIGIVCLPLLRHKSTYLILGCCCFVGFLGLVYIESTKGLDVFVEKVLLSSSKSGSLREITSLTGRTEIWKESLRLISLSPIIGYGGGSSARILVEFSGHSHNVLLETALLYGVISAGLVTLLMCLNIKDAIYCKIPLVPEFTAFVVILGMVESPMVGMPADPILAFWFAAIFARPLQLLEGQLRAARSIAVQSSARTGPALA